VFASHDAAREKKKKLIRETEYHLPMQMHQPVPRKQVFVPLCFFLFPCGFEMIGFVAQDE
jgi:hypothetical protein